MPDVFVSRLETMVRVQDSFPKAPGPYSQFNQPPRQLSVAIPLWIGEMSAGYDYGHRWERTTSPA